MHYNASVVKIYYATSSLVRFENKIISSALKNAIDYCNAGIVPSCKFESRRIGSWRPWFESR
jgi:hypothetical protein